MGQSQRQGDEGWLENSLTIKSVEGLRNLRKNRVTKMESFTDPF